jgi:hypothetical protein
LAGHGDESGKDAFVNLRHLRFFERKKTFFTKKKSFNLQKLKPGPHCPPGPQTKKSPQKEGFN